MLWRLALLPLLMLCAGCTAAGVMRSTAGFPAGTGFLRHTIVVDGTARTVWIFVPDEYTPQNRLPAIVFLHGLFEAGRSSDACITSGLGPVIARKPRDWPFITIFPQSDGTWRGPAREKLVLASLDYAQRHWSIDPDRVALAGLSYGGLGTWEIGARHPDRFSALVPVAGPSALEVAARVALLPVWAFAYTGDVVIAARSSREMCSRIAAGGGEARLTQFGGIGHDCWDRAVEESELVPWLLSQRRRSVDPEDLVRTTPGPPVYATLGEDR